MATSIWWGQPCAPFVTRDPLRNSVGEHSLQSTKERNVASRNWLPFFSSPLSDGHGRFQDRGHVHTLWFECELSSTGSCVRILGLWWVVLSGGVWTLCVCMFIYMCMWAYTHSHTCLHMHVRICMYVSLHTCVCFRLQTGLCVRVPACICMLVCIPISVCMLVCVHMRICMLLCV